MPPRTVGSVLFALELDGKIAGWLQKVSGGAAHADVVTEPGGQKHVGAIHFEDIVVSCGTGMSKAFYDWVAQGSDVQGGSPGKSGAVVTCDLQQRVLSRLEWSFGRLTAINFPALDAASKGQAALTVKISPEMTRQRAGDGSHLGYQYKPHKAWLSQNFRLKIDGLEEACSRVSRIGPVTITHDMDSVPIADGRDPESEIGRVHLSDLIITLPESRATVFYDWFEDFVIKGNNSPTNEKNGTLDFLTPNLSSTLFSLQFSHLGIYEMTSPSNLPGTEINKVTAKMYCEAIQFVATGAAS
jgi:hypothetical protein